MFICKLCTNSKFTNGQSFMAHFMFEHSKQIASKDMVCCHVDCFGRKFDKLNSFRKHVLGHKCMPPTSSQCKVVFGTTRPSNTQIQITGNIEGPKNSEPSEMLDVDFTIENISNSVKFDEALTKSVVTFIAGLYDAGSFTEAQIQQIIEGHMQLLGGGYLDILKGTTLELLIKASVNEKDVKNVSRMFDSCQNLFAGFETHFKRIKEMENCGAYIPPETFIIGHAEDEQIKDGTVVKVPIELKGQFVPFHRVLKGFLELPGVFREILDYIQILESRNDSLENVVQGKLWREQIKPKFDGKCVLPLNFYYDEYECNKELGTHTGVHKMGAGYIQISCIPPKFRSLLENIFLVLLVHSADRAHGNHRVFRKVINELIFLENEGILVVTPEGVVQVHFALCLVTGDNLGLNGILGFVECFSAKFFCRVCCEQIDVTRYQTKADPKKKRTKESYEQDLLINNPSLTGRKERCVFNELKSYHVSENNYVDIMHDLDEGVWKRVMYNVVLYLFMKRRFSLDYLNEMIQGFHYGPNEARNRLPYLSHNDLIVSKRLPFNGSETRCFVRYFSLMVGHCILEEDKEVWALYLRARHILDIVTAPRIKQSEIVLLRLLITEHHSEFMRIFDDHLRPKFHLMLHEPDLIEELGPLEPISCYRMESKHKQGKDIAHRSHNRINAPYTICKGHQLTFAFRLISGRGFASKCEFSSVHPVPLHQIDGYSSFACLLPPDHVQLPPVWHIAGSCTVNGAKYSKGTVVLHSFKYDLPVFGQIHIILVGEDNKIHFVLKVLRTLIFDKHYHAFKVKETTEWLFTNNENLVSYVPTEVRIIPNGDRYVAFRFDVKQTLT